MFSILIILAILLCIYKLYMDAKNTMEETLDYIKLMVQNIHDKILAMESKPPQEDDIKLLADKIAALESLQDPIQKIEVPRSVEIIDVIETPVKKPSAELSHRLFSQNSNKKGRGTGTLVNSLVR
jgi:hypothetical protein